MKKIHSILRNVRSRKLSVNKAYAELKHLPFKNIGFAKLDLHRAMRKGFPEVVFGQGKTPEQILGICKHLDAAHGGFLVTRTCESVYRLIKKNFKGAAFDAQAKIIYKIHRKASRGNILILTAGTSDIPVAREAELTARVMGNRVSLVSDVGVAGVHRLFTHLKKMERANVIIVVAGMEGALASIVSGLVSKPMIAVPTSVGYGASFKGVAPLLTMLNCCSPGVVVVNIDNGFGAGYFASMINKQAGSR